MAWRSQITGDQGMLIELGWPLVEHGQWLQHGMPTSAGGRSPGGFTSLLMALPLWLWADYRSPAIFLAVVHAGAFLLLRRWLRPALTENGDWLLLLLVWLNPWRMYFSAHIWNANFMFVMAVLHLGLAQSMREKNFVATVCMCLLIALGMQLHTSVMVLAIASLLMFWKRFIKVHWGGVLVGIALGVAAAVPWLLEVMQHPELKPGGKGFFMRGLIYVFPLVRGVLYWLKMSSLSLAARMSEVDFVEFPARLNSIIKPIAVAIGTLAHLTLLSVIAIQWRFFKRQYIWLRAHWRDAMQAEKPRAWLRQYIVFIAIAALISFAVSPTTVMFWQAFIVLPASALITIFWVEAAIQTPKGARIILISKLWAAFALFLIVAQTFGGPHFRCDAENAVIDPILRNLNVTDQCHPRE